MIFVAFLPHTGYQQVEQLIKNIMKSIYGQYFVQLILHDNASPYKSNVVKELLEGYGWEVLDHPPYSPDLSPPDFDLFPKLKEPLRGVRYDTLEELECAVNAEVRRINFSCIATGIEALPSRWNFAIRSRGDYFEGL